MFGLLKKQFLRQKQGAIKKKSPSAHIVLHQDMPLSSVDQLVGMAQRIEEINALEPAIQKLSDAQLRQKTDAFRQHIAMRSQEVGPEIATLLEIYASSTMPEEKDKLKEKIKLARNKIFAGILSESFAVVREASRRAIGLRHFDVQLAGGIVLHEGRIAEMATGEGKTLVATLPAYLNALLGKGVHIVTVNDYLAKRDSEWMGPIFQFLGLRVGVIQHEMSDAERKQAYSCDITYGTNNEFGFDYLRDNMKYGLEDLVQREFYYAIVDEVDSILIDEARTPLIISGSTDESTDKYYTARGIASQLKGRRITEKDEIDAKYKGEDLSKGFDYIADEKAQTIAITETGEIKASRLWGISDLHSLETMEQRHHTIQALRAKEYFRPDVDYVVKDGGVVIVDEFTGRLMPGRRWSDGLHQAIEAKEGLKIEQENQTLASITFQNYFRMYEKLAGMTGTAFTEASEFKAIYKLDVVVVPTNRPLIRTNYADCIYKTEKEKFNAVVEEIAGLYEKGRPVLVGTISIEKSEFLSSLLTRKGIPHQVLNAKYHEMEAQIVAQAGRFKAITIATNMAGRGTDILLGGNPENMAKNIARQQLKNDDPAFSEEYRKLLDTYRAQTDKEHAQVVALGGLHVLGTERHEARRIDNQLRGRSGRQGDPGSSRFYVSLEDDLMRLFGSDRITFIMDKLGFEEGQVIEHPWVSRSIEIAQRRVEQHNFEIRKQLLEYDNVMNKQREIVYGQRRQILEGVSLKDSVMDALDKAAVSLANSYAKNEGPAQEIDAPGLVNFLKLKFGVELDEAFFAGIAKEKAQEKLFDTLAAAYEEKEGAISADTLRQMERIVFLQIIDAKWKDHLYAMDKLREGIGLRAYGQRDPLIEYKREAFLMFNEMISGISEEACEEIFRLQLVRPERMRGVFSTLPKELVHPQGNRFEGPQELPPQGSGESLPASAVHINPPAPLQPHVKVGRNDPCPCGSGKKYKKCCGG
ncbi:MAG: preprotein translocase subunit SecA [Candidatus Omnitrophica bacterium]|nr:preprotein translocase subunit SecA [Candidatus Omnitrophota bacterium]